MNLSSWETLNFYIFSTCFRIVDSVQNISTHHSNIKRVRILILASNLNRNAVRPVILDAVEHHDVFDSLNRELYSERNARDEKKLATL